MDDFRLPPADALPRWRQNPRYNDLGLSAELVALLDEFEQQEAAMGERLRERTAANRALIDQGNVLLNARHAEQLRTDVLSDGELRAELADAIDEFNMARRRLGDAELVLQRANTSVAEAQARMAQYTDLDERVTQFHVARIKNSGDEGLPADLVGARREQRDAADALTASQNAYVILAAECQEARAAAEHFAQLRDQAAVAADLSARRQARGPNRGYNTTPLRSARPAAISQFHMAAAGWRYHFAAGQ